MSQQDIISNFQAQIAAGYQFSGAYINMGIALLNGQVVPNSIIKAPLKNFNRHGLIAGATGTGKTKTLQLIAEGLSANGVAVLCMDIKGDLSGIAQPGSPNPKIADRHQKIGIEWQSTQYPVELLTLSNQKGTRLCATLLEFGPVLFSKILDLNETQTSVVAVIFKYCDDNNLPLLDLNDFKKVLQFATNEGKDEFTNLYGNIAITSSGSILRKIVEIEQQSADLFLGEPSFDVKDLLRRDESGKGYISIVRLTDIQDRPKLFSTFMLSLLSEIYQTFPEAGDLPKPKLVIFIDEAHLVFNEASQALLDQIETIVKLIRSKGVGLFFCTQNPQDVPNAVLGQLGMKVQHALRAFTAKDRKDIKLTAENYPLSDFYDTDEVITNLGIGEALFTALDDKGRPTPLAAVLMCAPASRMDVLTENEIDDLVCASEIAADYNKDIDRESAYEILSKRIAQGQEVNEEEETSNSSKTEKDEPGWFEKLTKNTMVRQVGRTVGRELTRGLLGVLGIGGRKTTSSKKRSSWF